MTEKEQLEDKNKFPLLLMDNILRVFHGVNSRNGVLIESQPAAARQTTSQ